MTTLSMVDQQHIRDIQWKIWRELKLDLTEWDDDKYLTLRDCINQILDISQSKT